MKLLVTGALGNVGTALSTELQKNNIPFIGLDIVNQGSDNNNFLHLDITNDNDLDKKKSILNDYDTLIHLASEIGVGANVTTTGKDFIFEWDNFIPLVPWNKVEHGPGGQYEH